MELLIAMLAGAVSGAALRRGALWLPVATALGIAGGVAAWYLLALIGPGPKAGPLALVHLVAGAVLGAAPVLVAGYLRRRKGG